MLKIYTDEDLIEYLKKYYQEFGKVPTVRDLKKNKDYPTPETFRIRFGSHKNALIEAGLYHLREDKNLFDRKEYSKDHIIKLTSNFIKKFNRIPIYADFENNSELPSVNLVYKHFKNLNELIIILGYEPIYKSSVMKSDEELITDLKKLYIELGRTPTSRDIKECEHTVGVNAYLNRFGSVYEALERADIPYQKRTKFYTDQDIINVWYELKNELKRIPTRIDMENSDVNIYPPIFWRWGSYYDFLKDINENTNQNKIYFTNKGTKCLSYYEYRITSWLEDNGIKFEKEIPYRDIIKSDNTYRRFDWVINHNGKIYYLEMFGIIGDEYYEEKTANKIATCKENNIPLIALYPEDLKKPLDEVFSFLL